MLNKQESKNKISINFIIIGLVIAFIIIILMICKDIYNSTTSSISLVNPQKYLAEGEKEEVKKGKIIVNYIDTNGKKLADEEILYGNLGEEYNVTRKKIEGFKIYESDPINKKGNYDVTTSNIDFIYEKDESQVNSSSDGNNVVVQVIKDTEAEDKEYKFVVETQDEDGKTLVNSEYKVTNSNLSVIRNGRDYTGVYVIGSLTINKEGSDKYILEQKSVDEKYERILDSIEVSIIKKYDANIGQYMAEATIPQMNNVSVNVDEENRVITIIVKNNKKVVAPEPENPNPQVPDVPDKPEVPEVPYVPSTENRIFDLQMSKMVKEVKLTTNGKTTTSTKTGDKLLKIDIPKSKINGSILEVTYTLTITNVGEIAGYVTELTDKFPNEMKLSDNSNWRNLDGVAVSNELSEEEIKPGESLSVDITFTWILSEQNVGLKINEALISGYYNNEGIPDSTPENNDKEAILVTIKTGQKALITVEILVMLLLIVAIVYKLRKK